MAKYDRAAAFAYAERWALRRNPRYLDFSTFGGDCSNFISQCLYAGRHEMNYTPVMGWYYINGNDRTASWTGVEFLYQFLTHNQGAGPRAEVVSQDVLELGDVIQLGNANRQFYHSLLLVTPRGSEMRVAAHSNDAWMRPFSEYQYARARFLHITT